VRDHGGREGANRLQAKILIGSSIRPEKLTHSNAITNRDDAIVADLFRWTTTAAYQSLISQRIKQIIHDTNTSKMRAVLIKDGKGPIENLYIGETPTPSPGKGEALVKV